MEFRLEPKIRLLLVAFLFSQTFLPSIGQLFDEEEEDQTFPCYSLPRDANYTCSHCIQFHPTCAWCTKEGFDEGTKYSRCDTEERLRDHGCTKDRIENPKGKLLVHKNDSLTDKIKVGENVKGIIQLQPQVIRLTLRLGEKRTVSLRYKQAIDYPVDLYYVMDLSKSMSDDKKKLTELGDSLAARMRVITRNFRLGFGSFVDKKLMPFVDPRPEKADRPCDVCVAPYGFLHHMKLSEDTDQFSKEVNKSSISGNLDAPEGGFDAIMQSLVCKQRIGWREQSRKIIVFSSDAGFHYAGDGRLAGVVVPNDGQCHLDNENYYSVSTEQDYPSIAQLHQTIRKEQANLIFAVTKDQVPLYGRLLEALPDVSATVDKLAEDSSNIVELVENEYNKISQKIRIVDDASDAFKMTYKTKCKGSRWNDTNVCKGIKVGDLADFQVTLEAVKCKKNNTHVIKIGPAGLKEALRLEVEILCNCGCASPRDKHYEEFSEFCTGQGHLVCGVCQCVGENVGRKCECEALGQSSVELDAKCKKVNTSDHLCEGRGICDCGRCICNTRDNLLEVISGQFCECDNFNCPRHDWKICGGHGVCICGVCKCDEGYSGRSCHCSTSIESCIASNGKVCNGRGKCHCGYCVCDEDKEAVRYSGPTCEICATCPTKCQEYRACVMCQAFKTGPFNESECAKCQFQSIIVEELPERELNRSMIECQFVDPADDCTFRFMYELDEDTDNVTVWVKREKECPPPVPILAIVLGVIAGIVLIGLILLLVWKLLTILHDRREFARFEKERLMAKWDTGENPIFHPATTTFKNPAYGGRQ